MPKKRRVYISRVVGNQVMTSADLERLHKYMLEIEDIDHISDEMRAVVGSEWPELAHSCRRRNRRVEMMPSLTDSQTRSSSVARRPMAPIGSKFRTADGRVHAQCLNLEHEFHHTVSKLCILGFEPLK